MSYKKLLKHTNDLSLYNKKVKEIKQTNFIHWLKIGGIICY